MKKINATELKAKCLALLDEVARTSEGLIVLKHGKPIARVIPAVPGEREYPQKALKGTVRVMGDIVTPVLPPEAWEAEGRGK